MVSRSFDAIGFCQCRALRLLVQAGSTAMIAIPVASVMEAGRPRDLHGFECRGQLGDIVAVAAGRGGRVSGASCPSRSRAAAADGHWCRSFHSRGLKSVVTAVDMHARGS
ncbi:hypothetical protein GCM10027162_16790 [Streptomyces incanus]